MAKITLKIPKLAVSMQEGTILEWFVATGDTIERGQKIYSIESETEPEYHGQTRSMFERTTQEQPDVQQQQQESPG